MMRSLLLAIFLLVAHAYGVNATEVTLSRFNDIKINCDTCHGVGGRSPVPDQVPSIAGKSENYIISQIRAFKSGKRKHQTMALMGGEMTIEELRAIARYYSRAQRRGATQKK
jgi:cytochrome c553